MFHGRQQFAVAPRNEIDDAARDVADDSAAQVVAQAAEGGAVLEIDASVHLVHIPESVLRVQFADRARQQVVNADLFAALEIDPSRMGFECDPPEIIPPGAEVGIFVERRVGEPAVVVAHPVSEFVDSGRIEPARFGVVAQGPEHGVALGAVVVPADAVVDAEPVVGCEKDPAAVPSVGRYVPHLCVGHGFCALRKAFHMAQTAADRGGGISCQNRQDDRQQQT